MKRRLRMSAVIPAGVASGCSSEQAYAAGYATGQSVVLGIVTFVLVLVFGVLSFKYGAKLRAKRKLGAWFIAGGHALATLCGVALLLATGPALLRSAFAILGAAAMLVGHVGIWIVVLGTKAGRSKLTYDVGVNREESPGMHALAQGVMILFAFLLLAGGGIFFGIQGFASE